MQQPYYYRPEDDDESDLQFGVDGLTESMDEDRIFRYVKDQGRELTSEEREHVSQMKRLIEAYPDLHLARSLDESSHILLDNEAIAYRNRDQTLSWHIARSRANMEKSNGRTSQTQERLSEEDLTLFAQDNTLASPAMVTPLQLEEQQGSIQKRGSWMSRCWEYLKALQPQQIRRSDSKNKTQDCIKDSITESSKQIKAPNGTGAKSPPHPDYRGIRQQILVVPQLWIWKIEGNNTINIGYLGVIYY